jgi:hypothetical protein
MVIVLWSYKLYHIVEEKYHIKSQEFQRRLAAIRIAEYIIGFWIVAID